ncbi:hypothetical protein BIU82_14150 [Arthrobacter sp. SW1]|nr:hypothetical protein BIU82_14150 [Arthrobacter sp. SW1]
MPDTYVPLSQSISLVHRHGMFSSTSYVITTPTRHQSAALAKLLLEISKTFPKDFELGLWKLSGPQ